VIYAGVRDVDPPEQAFIDANRIALHGPRAIGDGSALAAVLAHPARRWHLHFDLDVLDPTEFPDVTIPTPGGPPLAAVAALLEAVVRARDVVGITVTEYVGGATGGAASARWIADVLAGVARAWG
jgi:arginase